MQGTRQFIPAEIIKKKRAGGELDVDELRFMVNGFATGLVPDYQVSALLMAVFFKGMSARETAALTDVMLHSGRTLSFRHLGSVAVDKHSTGGVGDKTSIVIAPVVAAAGVPVPMISGRGLGHTGGTLDKLESIPGFRVDLSLEDFSRQVEELGVALIGQTAEICPADKRIYALRDVTGTVESLPLICASIMSKKIAEGIDALVLDVKWGSGAFMKTLVDAEQLAEKLMEIGAAHGKQVVAWLTNMDQPLGRFIGNSLEVGECIAILKGESFGGRNDFSDCRRLSLELAGEMIWLGGKACDRDEGFAIAERKLESGEAWRMFERICERQGNAAHSAIPEARERHEVLAPSEGFVAGFDCEKIGIAAIALGAGRLKASDKLDFSAGIEVHRKLGDHVRKGDRLFTLFTSGADHTRMFDQAQGTLLAATNISLQKPNVPDLMTLRKVN
jgi:pyrimidine-nucleoside phosphorylase